MEEISYPSVGLRGGERILRYAVHSDILDLIGHDIILWGTAMFAKLAGDGMEVPWHQGGHYWPIRPLAAISV